jgi:SAM-dependent methyltransferase
MQNYEDWKNWSELNFAEASAEENLYFSKLRKKFKLSNDLDVLEIGYGNGSFLDFSRDVGWNVSGVEAIPELRNRASQDNFEEFASIDDVQKRYDLIVAFDVLEHIKPKELLFFLEKIKRCLNPNGAFIIRTPNGSSPLGLVNQHGDETHVNIFTESKMRYWANSSNLNLYYYGGDIFLIYNGKILKTPFRLIKRILQVFIERVVRWIFSPQSKGVLSSNSLYKLTLKNNES